MGNFMENLNRGLRNAASTLRKHSPEILMGAGIVGFVSTVVMVAKESPRVKEELDILYEEIDEREENGETFTKPQLIFEEIKVAAPIYAPAFITGSLSIVCVLGSYKIVTKRTAAFAAAYELASSNLKKYREKTKELYGDKKEEKIRNEVAKDILEDNPPTNEVLVTDGKILFYDTVSGRYFKSTVDEVRKAEKKISERLPVESWVTLNEFYYEIGISNIKLGDELGFNVGDGIDIYFNSTVAPGEIPCLVMEYMAEPRLDFRKLY